MCASYGLGGGEGMELPAGLPQLDDREDYTRLAAWVSEYDGQARIAGRRALNYNPVILQRDSRLRLDLGWWSLWIAGRLRKEYSTFNARDDKLMTSPWWRAPFASTRALLPATWYVEKGKRFELAGEPFTIAALYNVADIDGVARITYTMVTRAAVAEASTVHPRMPLVVPESMRESWLDQQQAGDAGLLSATIASSEAPSAAMAIAG